MESNNENNNPDVDAQIAHLFELIDRELEKPDDEVDIDKVDAYFSEIDKLDGGAYKKSEEELNQNLAALYKKAKQPAKKPVYILFNTLSKRVAIITLAVGLFLTLTACAFVIRLPNIQFLVAFRERFSEMFFNQEDISTAPDTIETIYTLNYVPDDYELIEQKITEIYIKTIWTNDANENIILIQECLASNKHLDNENNDFEILNIDGTNYVVYEKNNQKKYIWNDNQYVYSLTVTNSIHAETLAKILTPLVSYSND